MNSTQPPPQSSAGDGNGGGGSDENLSRLVALEEKIQHLASDVELQKVSAKIDVELQKVSAKIDLGLSRLKIWILGGCLTAVGAAITVVIYLTSSLL